MMVVHKYSLDTWTIELDIPEGSEFLTAQLQGGVIQLWVKVDLDKPKKTYSFYTIMTGQELPYGDLKYVSTLQKLGQSLVYHIFYKEKE